MDTTQQRRTETQNLKKTLKAAGVPEFEVRHDEMEGVDVLRVSLPPTDGTTWDLVHKVAGETTGRLKMFEGGYNGPWRTHPAGAFVVG